VVLIGTGGFLGVPPVSADTDFGQIVVSIENPQTGQRGHGYVEYRVRIVNRSPQSEHQVKLTIPGLGYGSGSDYVNSRVVTVAASSSVVVPMMVPVLPTYGNGIAVEIDGVQQASLAGLALVQSGERRACVLVSEDSEPFSSLVSTRMTGTNLQFSAINAEQPAHTWSENWLAYSSYDGIVLKAHEFHGMPTPVAVAIWRFVEAGGTLLVIGNIDIPQQWRVRQDVDAPLSTYHVGFGQCIITADNAPNHFDTGQWLFVQESFISSHRPWSSAQLRDGIEANRLFPVVDKLTVPVRGLFLLMLLFVIVIGPVNLLLLAKTKKKMWLLWTVPAISFMTCIAVSVYTVFAEGWSGRSRTASITILDENSHRATTLGWTAFYSPLTPGDGLRFDYESELNPQLEMGSYYRSGGSSERRTIDWTNEQHLTSGWMTARIPTHFAMRKSEVRRERLAVKLEQDSSLSVVNGLGADIKELWLADRQGRIYHATNLAAGASVKLMSQGNSVASGAADILRSAFDSQWFDVSVVSDPNRSLIRDCYIAVMDRSPFLEEGMSAVRERKSEAVVYGLIQGPGNEN
jgi:hypothetical protein